MVQRELRGASRLGRRGLRRRFGSRRRNSEDVERVKFPLPAELAGLFVVTGEFGFRTDLCGFEVRCASGSDAKGLRNDETEEQQGLKEPARHYSPIVAQDDPRSMRGGK